MSDPLGLTGLWFDADGKPISLRRWAMLLRNDRYKILAQTWVTDDIQVSTVWLGLDYGLTRFFPGHENDPPLIFETMVFIRSDTPQMIFGRVIDREGTEWHHWPSRETALAGHMQIVSELRACADVETVREPVE